VEICSEYKCSLLFEWQVLLYGGVKTVGNRNYDVWFCSVGSFRKSGSGPTIKTANWSVRDLPNSLAADAARALLIDITAAIHPNWAFTSLSAIADRVLPASTRPWHSR
jgi:hypothetical protein